MQIQDYLMTMTDLTDEDIMGLDLHGYDTLGDAPYGDMYGSDMMGPGREGGGGRGRGGLMGGMAQMGALKRLAAMSNKSGQKAGSPLQIPGNYQMPPDRDLSHKPDDPSVMGLRGKQGGVVRVSTDPAGMAQPAGAVMKNNYPKLRGLASQARVWS